MKRLSDRINRLSESQTIAMAAMSRELKNKGIDVISLSLGEPDFDTPDFIKEAAKKAIDENYTHYPPVPGYLEVREAISKKFKRDNNITYSPNQIVISTGAKQALMNIVLSLVNPGEEVILPAPYWVSYYAMAEMAEAKIVEMPTSVENDFKITAQELKETITPNSRLIMMSSPCNPSGSVYTKDELKAIADVVAENPHVYIIFDEIYEHINFTEAHASLAQFDHVYDQVITVNGVAKGFAMTGWRIGYIGAPEWIAKAATKIQGQFTSGANTIGQMATKAAVEADPKQVYFMRDQFQSRRDLMISLLSEIPGFKLSIPTGAFYLFPDVSAYFGKKFEDQVIENSTDLSMYILNEAHVALVTGEAFGSPNCIRFSYAAHEDVLKEAVNRIKEGLAKLK